MIEEWKAVPGFEDLYEVSSAGLIRSLPRPGINNKNRIYGGKNISPSVRKKDGYLVVSLHKSGRQVQRNLHQLVAQAFHGPAPHGYECCHNNGIKADCRKENLRWGTKLENSSDKYLHGTMPIGSSSPNSKLKERDVLHIRDSSENTVELGKRFGVSNVTIGRIRNRITWKHI